MTPEQANAAMAALREGRTLKRFASGGKFGPAIVSLQKLKKHCALYPEWGAEAMRLARANAKATDAQKRRAPSQPDALQVRPSIRWR